MLIINIFNLLSSLARLNSRKNKCNERMIVTKPPCAFVREALQCPLIFNLPVGFLGALEFNTRKKNFNFKAEYIHDGGEFAKGKLLRFCETSVLSVGVYTATLHARGVKATIKVDLIRPSTVFFHTSLRSFPSLRYFIIGNAPSLCSPRSFNWKPTGTARGFACGLYVV
jgi:hypothetical protein